MAGLVSHREHLSACGGQRAQRKNNMREFLLRTLKSAIENWLVILLTTTGVAIGGWLLWLYRAYLKDWLFANWSIEMPVLAWMLVCAAELLLAVYFILVIVEKFGRLKNPRDIINAIEDWFTNDYVFSGKPRANTPYFFDGVEKSLNLKRGSSKIYLPLIALKHGYVFQMGKKTFMLSKLTGQNDPSVIFEQHLKPLETSEKEVLISCNDIDGELGWPKGAFKSFLLRWPPKNINFGVDIEDLGEDKIRIVRK
jgi:hypothetical protein